MTSQRLDRFTDMDPTPDDAGSGGPATLVLPRPQLARDPEHRADRAAIAAALFGGSGEVVRVGRFRVLGRIGEGGMGVVHAGHDDALGRRVAIKLLHATVAEDGGERPRLLREAQALARLSHPNVVQLFEVGTHEGRLFVAMEHVQGETLQRWLSAAPRPWREVLAVFLAAGRGLAAAHAVGLVHRDFKPGNVMLGADGRPRVLDFGLARALDERPADEAARVDGSALALPLTLTGGVVGTPAYMAPEQLAGQRCDARSDQFSFCVALFEGLYGARPFRGATLEEVVAEIRRGEPALPPAGARVPAWLHAAVLRGLARDPAARWPAMDALLAELAADREGTRRRRTSAAIAGLSAALLGIAGAVFGPQLRDGLRARGCADLGAEIVEVWNPEARARLAGIFATSASPEIRRSAAFVLDSLDDAAEDWRARKIEGCAAPPPAIAEAAWRQAKMDDCFDRARDALRAEVAVLMQVGGQIGPAGDVFWDRERPASCLDPEELSKVPEVPEDALGRARWQSMLMATWRGELAVEAGRLADAESLLGAALSSAPELPRLERSAWEALARVRFAAGQRRRAWAALERSLATGDAWMNSQIALSGLDLQMLLGGATGRPLHALAIRSVAPQPQPPDLVATLRQAVADEKGAPFWRRGPLRGPDAWWIKDMAPRLSLAAEVHVGLGDFADGEEAARSGLVIASSQPLDPELAGDLHRALGEALLGLGRLADARRELLLARAYAEDPASRGRRGRVRLALARVHLAAGKLAAADHELAAAERLASGADADDRFVPALLLARGELRERRGDLEGARSRYEDARRALRASHGVARRLLVETHVGLGRLALARGELRAADEALREALRLDEELVGAEHPAHAPILALLGRQQRRAGDLAGARGSLERALASLEGRAAARHVLGDIRTELARTLAAQGVEADRSDALIAAARADHQASEAPRTGALAGG